MSEEKKIIVDEDWKSQIAAEKEALEAEAAEKASEPEKSETPPPGEMPPASLELLVTTFATEAMMAMGQLPNPATNEISVNAPHARYAIDMLEVLQEKTKGNLSENEETMLRDVLHQLRMMFVSVG